MKNAKALPLPKFFKRMYRYALVILLASSLFSCDIRGKKNRGDVTAPGILPEGSVAQTTKDTTTVEIIDSVYNFGSVVDGDKVEYNYRFKNTGNRSEEHTSELQSRQYLVCRLLLEKKKEK